MVGVFETSIQDLIQCDGYYTTVLDPTNDEMFGSIQVLLHRPPHSQILAERITDDHSETTLSLNLDRFYHTPSHLYLIVSRLRQDGVLIPIFRSKVLSKKKHNNTSPDEATPVEGEEAQRQGLRLPRPSLQQPASAEQQYGQPHGGGSVERERDAARRVRGPHGGGVP